jgi:hypothetical protein
MSGVALTFLGSTAPRVSSCASAVGVVLTSRDVPTVRVSSCAAAADVAPTSDDAPALCVSSCAAAADVAPTSDDAPALCVSSCAAAGVALSLVESPVLVVGFAAGDGVGKGADRAPDGTSSVMASIAWSAPRPPTPQAGWTDRMRRFCSHRELVSIPDARPLIGSTLANERLRATNRDSFRPEPAIKAAAHHANAKELPFGSTSRQARHGGAEPQAKQDERSPRQACDFWLRSQGHVARRVILLLTNNGATTRGRRAALHVA